MELKAQIKHIYFPSTHAVLSRKTLAQLFELRLNQLVFPPHRTSFLRERTADSHINIFTLSKLVDIFLIVNEMSLSLGKQYFLLPLIN